MNLRVAKYWSFFVCGIKTHVEYSWDYLLRLLRHPVRIGLFLFIWSAIFSLSGKQVIAGLGLNLFLTYILVAGVMGNAFVSWYVYEIMRDDIRRGKLSLLLVRPINYVWVVFCKSFKDSFMDLASSIPFAAIILFWKPFSIDFFVPSLLFFFLFVVSFVLACFLAFLVFYLINLAMFWTGDLWSIWGTIESFQILLAGQIIPLTASNWLYVSSLFLPFRHMIFTPAFIFIEQFSFVDALLNIGAQFLWIVALYFLSAYVLKMGLRKFDSQGG